MDCKKRTKCASQCASQWHTQVLQGPIEIYIIHSVFLNNFSTSTRTVLRYLAWHSQNCEQFINFECNNDKAFIEDSNAWWISRDGTRMNYWGWATGHDKMCACGVTNSCTGGTKCNCDNRGRGWYEDSGLLTDKAALPVTQIRLGDLNGSDEEGYYTLAKLKCYGQV